MAPLCSLGPDEYLLALEREGKAFTAAVQAAGQAPVPTCPGWTIADLAVHLGVVHRWAAEMVRTAAVERLPDRETRFEIDPTEGCLLEWFSEGLHNLRATLSAAPADRKVWSWIPGSTTAFWCRRLAHETTIHRWDAQAAALGPAPIESHLAADGVDEALTVFAAGRNRAMSTRLGRGESFRFQLTDLPREWVVRFNGTGIEVSPNGAPTDVSLRGQASDLELFLWGRIPGEALDISGDASLLGRWFELVPTV